VSKDSRSTRFFVIMLIALGVAMYVGIMFATTIDSCGRGSRVQKHWEYLPPRWVCGPG
jgi:hypothetical protein